MEGLRERGAAAEAVERRHEHLMVCVRSGRPLVGQDGLHPSKREKDGGGVRTLESHARGALGVSSLCKPARRRIRSRTVEEEAGGAAAEGEGREGRRLHLLVQRARPFVHEGGASLGEPLPLRKRRDALHPDDGGPRSPFLAKSDARAVEHFGAEGGAQGAWPALSALGGRRGCLFVLALGFGVDGGGGIVRGRRERHFDARIDGGEEA